MTIQAIETQYKGYRFRSRLEARWAVFFDALGVRWEYEPEGFELPSGRYLPDFWLPKYDLYVEIKGKEPSEATESKLRSFAYERMLLVLVGAVGGFVGSLFCFDLTDSSAGDSWWDVLWCIKEPEGDVGLCISMENRREREFSRIADYGELPYVWHAHYVPGLRDQHPRLLAAYTAARAARFEYGEQPTL